LSISQARFNEKILKKSRKNRKFFGIVKIDKAIERTLRRLSEVAYFKKKVTQELLGK